MAEIHPFYGVRYNQKAIKNLANVICPPYDVITPGEQLALYLKSTYNMVRLEFGLQSSLDTPTNNRFTRAAAILKQWLEGGILQFDTAPAFYLHDQYFSYRGRKFRRRGLIARVRLEPWEKGIIRPHENTIAGMKSDRLELLRACQTNFSPLLALYEDPRGEVSSLLSSVEVRRPLINQQSAGGEGHVLWAIVEAEVIEKITHHLASQRLYIADGHHRYETALSYQQERSASGASSKEAFNFVMMTLVSFSDPGLIILPLHRLVRGLSSSILQDLKHRLKDFFEVEATPLNKIRLGSPRFYKEFLLRKEGRIAFGLLGLEPKQFLNLTLKPDIDPEAIVFGSFSRIYKELDVSVLHHLIVNRLKALDGVELGYTPREEEAWRHVESGNYQLAFLLKPVSVGVVKAIADAGERMPGKSTYFYPKLPTGLVINLLQEPGL